MQYREHSMQNIYAIYTLYCNLEDFVECDTETAINRKPQNKKK